jgi:hypothetical protein
MSGLFEMSDFNLPRVELHKPYGVFSAALVVISHFSDSLYSQISNGLTELYGDNWKKKLKDDEILPKEFNFRDPQAILKELARNGSSQLRLPLNAQISRDKLSYFYDGLDDLLGERNAWVHRQLAENLPELKDLAKTTSELLSACSIPFSYVDWIEDLLTFEAAVDSSLISPESNAEVITLQDDFQDTNKLNQDKGEIELQIGDAVSSRFMTHSYVVEPYGDISDRNTGVKLSEFNSVYQNMLQVLLSDLKTGSRLRLTQEGQLCSFFEDHWGYLTKISPKEWFPNHLK